MDRPEPSIDPPLIYISYSHTDKAWLEEILTRLKPMESAGKISIFYDRQLVPGAEWDRELRRNLEKAAFGIIVLSPDWLANDYANKVEFPALASRARLIPLLVRECNWNDHPISRYQILGVGKPLSELRGKALEQTFRVLTETIEREFLKSDGIRLSREAQQVYDLAVRIKQFEDRDTASLIWAFLERGIEEPQPVKTPQFLWNALPPTGRKRYAKVHDHLLTQLRTSHPASVRDLQSRILQRAALLSGTSLAGGAIHARHLLAAVLMDPDGPPVLSELDIDVEDFKRKFLVFVFDAFPDEPKEVWTSFFENSSASSEPQPDTEPPAGSNKPLIASYQSEDWSGPDLLNTQRDVNALAALVAGWNVQPPLSIGLFGEWGSGKSFFMRQMQKRIKTLALAAQASGKPQRECAYYKNIAQIEFNAWHYMEGDNLWACLVEHIFSNLGFPQDTTAAEVQARQKHILEQIGAKRNLEAQATQNKIELEAKRDDAEKKANEARTQLHATEAALKEEKSALKQKIADRLSSDVTDVLNSVPEAVQLRDTVETARKLSDDVRTVAGRVKLLWNLLRYDPQRRKMLSWMLGGSAILYGLGQIVQWAAPDIKFLVRRDVQTILPIVTALVSTALKFRPVLTKISSIVTTLEKRNREITEAIARAEKEQRQEIAKLEGNVESLSQQIEKATREQEEHQQAIDKLEKELAATDASQLLAEFIKTRAEADDYRKHLGMVALVRRDFERLSDFFRSQRDEERRGKERPDNNTVNRIVLYIDDLDRCPPQTVVNVLQAIHLLLAFPIFVVVVAVDSRWISRSLEECYDWLVPDTESTVQPRITSNGAERLRSTTGATAHDYLEKIFQIPFWLAPMSSNACQAMIRGLTHAIHREQSALNASIAAASQQKASPSALAATAGASGAGSAPGSSSTAETATPQMASMVPSTVPHTPTAESAATPEPAPETIDLTPRQLDVEDAELKKVDELAVLIGRSPRVAKRFLNCYRLLKARMDQAELETFLQGHYEYVMEVLAIIVGAPSISRSVVEALSGQVAKDGKTLIEHLEKHLTPASLSNTEWSEVKRLFSTASAEHLNSLCGVAPAVSRFSFATHGEHVTPTPGTPQKKAKSKHA